MQTSTVRLRSAHNVVLLHVMRVFGELLKNDVLYNRNQLYRRLVFATSC